MRDLCKVIENMLEVIPTTETGFIQGLKSCHSSAAFSAPELMGLRWERTVEVMQDYMPDNSDAHTWEEWQRQVIDAWQGNQDWRKEI